MKEAITVAISLLRRTNEDKVAVLKYGRHGVCLPLRKTNADDTAKLVAESLKEVSIARR